MAKLESARARRDLNFADPHDRMRDPLRELGAL
jgi:hypothetical protein